MSSILQCLFDGKIIPWERRSPESSEQARINDLLNAEEQYFKGKLSPEDFLRYQRLSQLHSKLTETQEDELFAYSFSLGVLLMQEIIEQRKQIIPEPCH